MVLKLPLVGTINKRFGTVPAKSVDILKNLEKNDNVGLILGNHSSTSSLTHIITHSL